MEKLTIEHLAPYLPYGLQGYASDINLTDIITLQNVEFIIIEQPRALPILRPLKDFYINRDGYGGYIALSDFKYAIINKQLPYKVFINLIKNHFDVFDLIEKGLAIDINTLDI